MKPFITSKEETPLLKDSRFFKYENYPTSNSPLQSKNENKMHSTYQEETFQPWCKPNLSSDSMPEECTFVRTFEILPSEITPDGNIECSVCHKDIDLLGKHHQYIVKCDSCKESMPIKRAPIGKKYIRCFPPCNCLLVSGQKSDRIKCPRPNCQRILECRKETRLNFLTQSIPGIRRVKCGYCYERFLWNIEGNKFAHCPHCNRRSSINEHYKNAKTIKFLILGMLMLAIAIGILFLTTNQMNFKEWFIAIYVVMFVIAVALIGRCIFFLRMKQSRADVLE